jgi:hypothetical protein
LIGEPARLQARAGRKGECVVEDLSLGGARILIDDGALAGTGDTVTLELEGVGALSCSVLDAAPATHGGSADTLSSGGRRRRGAAADGGGRASRLRVRFVEMATERREALIRTLFGGDYTTESMVPLNEAMPDVTVVRVLTRIAGARRG